jgi:hypothetical protein
VLTEETHESCLRITTVANNFDGASLSCTGGKLLTIGADTNSDLVAFVSEMAQQQGVALNTRLWVGGVYGESPDTGLNQWFWNDRTSPDSLRDSSPLWSAIPGGVVGLGAALIVGADAHPLVAASTATAYGFVCERDQDLKLVTQPTSSGLNVGLLQGLDASTVSWGQFCTQDFDQSAATYACKLQGYDSGLLRGDIATTTGLSNTGKKLANLGCMQLSTSRACACVRCWLWRRPLCCCGS